MDNKKIILIASIVLVLPFIILVIDAVGDYRDSFLNRLID